MLFAVVFGATGRAGDEKSNAVGARELVRKEPLELDLGGGVTVKLVWIPPGEFMMGSPKDERNRLPAILEEEAEDEGPQHRVKITQGFYMSVHEVTQEQYQAVMGNNPSKFKGARHPVDFVSWHDAMEFCRRVSSKLGMAVRLPTEAEWEYACRAGTTTPFHFGETISTDQANYDGDRTYGKGREGEDRRKTVPVGSFLANDFGLYDMHGNVCEWCADWYDPNYYRNSPSSNPKGPANGRDRVLRGGSWMGSPGDCRSACRSADIPWSRYGVEGLRVVVASQESSPF